MARKAAGAGKNVASSLDPEPGTASRASPRFLDLTHKQAATMLSASFGIVLLAIAIFIPTPTAFQILVFRLLLAAIAAGLGVAIGARLGVEGTVAGFSIRAAGAAALFVAVYFLNPPALLVASQRQLPPAGTAAP